MVRRAEERRQYSRVNFDAHVTITQGDTTIEAEVRDISLNGLLINTPEHYQLRSDLPCRARIDLCDEVHIVMQVTLVHSSDICLGLHCTSIDMDSISHLRRLIETNLNDPHASERVLSELIG